MKTVQMSTVDHSHTGNLILLVYIIFYKNKKNLSSALYKEQMVTNLHHRN